MKIAEKEKAQEKMNAKLSEMLDPSTKKLFAMLPAPKQSQVSLSTVYRDTQAQVAII